MGRLAQALVRWLTCFARRRNGALPVIARLVAATTAWLTSDTAAAEAHSYALVIGANRGGSGQAPLQYAQRDAQHIASLLVELGRTPREQITLLLDPTPAQIANTLQQLRAQLAVHAQAGEHARLLFFYSGHARARSLSLAAGELPLDTLREALLGLPSTLTVAILDACQSGAISNIKGALATTDFSTSTVSDLNNAGVAVMASSTALEFSQESPELGASYFTHHLITGLRGAADRDGDHSVSLDEVYAYAYQHTLSDTARTRVGSQHATLEMELKGHGSVPLTYTRDADAQLRLAEPLDGRIIVQQKGRGAVLAELSKSYGSVLTLAFPHGAYDVLVRRGIALPPQACALTLTRGMVHALDTRGCPTVPSEPLVATKGGSALEGREFTREQDANAFERWFFELGIGRRWASDDAYVTTLQDFRYVGKEPTRLTPVFVAGVGALRYLSVLARVERLADRRFDRVLEGDRRPVAFSYRSWSVALGLRGRWPFLAERLVPFAEFDLGVATARSEYRQQGFERVLERHNGYVLRADVGLTVHMFWRVGALLSGGYDYAPALKNEFGQKHNDGGFHFTCALRLRGLKQVDPP